MEQEKLIKAALEELNTLLKGQKDFEVTLEIEDEDGNETEVNVVIPASFFKFESYKTSSGESALSLDLDFRNYDTGNEDINSALEDYSRVDAEFAVSEWLETFSDEIHSILSKHNIPDDWDGEVTDLEVAVGFFESNLIKGVVKNILEGKDIRTTIGEASSRKSKQ